jgi:DNA-binding FadR family transcriptional regulator
MASQIHLVPQPKRRLADILYGQLLEQIVAGVLVPGNKLPAENAISAAFGASRPVVREALMRLQADGLVEARRGSGTFLLHAPSAEITRLAEPADLSVYLKSIEVRMALEPEAARFAAQRRSTKDIVKIRAAADQFDRVVAAMEVGERFDIGFHRAIAVASGNELFARQLDGLNVEVEGFIGVSLGLTRLGSAERKAAVLDEHRHIVEAIEIGDGDLAATYMRFHLSQARRRVTDTNRQP